jgi:hypothetical protein
MGKMIALAIAACLLSATAVSAAAQGECPVIQDPQKRLECYDKMAKTPETPSTVDGNAYQAMSIEDFKLDYETLKGKKVQLSGVLYSAGPMTTLMKKAFDFATVVYVEVKNLPREQRKIVMGCAAGCSALVRGRVDTVFVMEGLVAEEIIVND